MKSSRKLTKQLQDSMRLLAEATEGASYIVQSMHQRIASGPEFLGKPLAPLVKALTSPTYETVRLITRLVSKSVDTLIEPMHEWLPYKGLERGTFLAALNGVLGDHLAAQQSSLAISMQICFQGQSLSDDPERLKQMFPKPQPLLLLLHGSSLDEQSWERKGMNYGRSLAEECGYAPLYLRYNTGLHISENGRLLAELLEHYLKKWPWPWEKLAFLGHSMGGLVALSAIHQASEQKLNWPEALQNLVSLGTPYHGSPLERTGNWFDVALGAYSYTEPLARLGKIRSAGVTDLRFGFFLEEHWRGRDRFAKGPDPRSYLALPKALRTCVIAGTRSLVPGKKLLSDGLVPVESALGQHRKKDLRLEIAEKDHMIIYGSHHLDLLSHPKVYEHVKRWLS